MTYNVKLDNFEGPLDLLLFLARKNEIDIQDILIVPITRQYMEYIEIMKALNLDIAGEFLVMAATLMQLKSRSLLPKTDEDEDVEGEGSLEELKQQLLEYQQYRDAAERLKEQNVLEKDVFTRPKFDEPLHDTEEVIIEESSLFDLLSALKTVLARVENSGDVFAISIEHMSVKDKISEIMSKLQEKGKKIEFTTFFQDMTNKIEIITTFLAMLELIKMQAVKIYQNMSFGSIYIYPIENEETQKELDD